jgi:hypothetical protein
MNPEKKHHQIYRSINSLPQALPKLQSNIPSTFNLKSLRKDKSDASMKIAQDIIFEFKPLKK